MTDTLRQQLHALQADLQAAGLWSPTPPGQQALQSTMPFMVDTLRIEQWLQWVFLPRMHALLDAGAPLPGKCGIQPLAELEWQTRQIRPWPTQTLQRLQDIDALLSA